MEISLSIYECSPYEQFSSKELRSKSSDGFYIHPVPDALRIRYGFVL